jgi:predicted adenylyl cyclase CyaB
MTDNLPKEIETKLRITNPEKIYDILEKEHAVLKYTCLELDTYFKHDKLGQDGTALRLRTKNVEGDTNILTSLTLKGPPEWVGGIKSREEIEIGVNDEKNSTAMRQFMDALGFVEVINFWKRRRLYSLMQCTVCVDILMLRGYHAIGYYVEVEGPNAAIIKTVQEKLGLGAIVPETISYADIVKEYMKKVAPTDNV